MYLTCILKILIIFFMFKFEWLTINQNLFRYILINNILRVISNMRIIKDLLNIKMSKIFMFPHIVNPLPIYIPPLLFNTHIVCIDLYIISINLIILKPSNSDLIFISYINYTKTINFKILCEYTFKNDSMIINASAESSG